VIAQEDERARVAHELHDEMAQILTGFALHLAILGDNAIHYPEMKDQVEHLKLLSQQMSRGIYRLVHDLRPAQLDDLGLVAALQYLVDDTRRRIGLRAKMIVDGKQHKLDPLVETVLFRGAQEALTNVARHAGVNEATVHLVYEPQRVRMLVQDVGKGIDLLGDQFPAESWGLAGMRERAEAVGGRLRIKSAPGEGTVVEIVIPNGKETVLDEHSTHVGG
jgi:two-component system sensor histidine kinase DegS